MYTIYFFRILFAPFLKVGEIDDGPKTLTFYGSNLLFFIFYFIFYLTYKTNPIILKKRHFM